MTAAAHTREMFAWLDQVKRDRELRSGRSPAGSAFLVAFEIAQHINRRTKTAWPSQATIAANLGLEERTVRREIIRLRERGHLDVQVGNGRGRPSVYQLIIKPAKERRTPESAFSAERRTPAPPFNEPKGGHQRRERRTPETLKADTGGSKGGHGASAIRTTEEPLKEQLREPLTLRAGARESESPPDFDSAFEAFWQAYPRKVAKAAARRAFAAAIKRDGIDPEILVAGAKRYAIERAGKPSRYTKHPATWIKGECWHDELEGAVTVDELGNIIAIEREDDAAPMSGREAAALLAQAYRQRGSS